MKRFLRAFVFTLIAFFFTSALTGAFYYSGDKFYGVILVIFALGILNAFLPFITNLLSLPDKGILSLLLNSGICFVMLYLLKVFLPQFDISTGNTPELLIFGFVIPSVSLSEMWALVVSSAVLTFIYKTLVWLGTIKEKK